MTCSKYNVCGCNINVKTVGKDDMTIVKFLGQDRTAVNWNEIQVQEVLCLPDLNPDIEYINEVTISVEILNQELIRTPYAYKAYRAYFISTDELTLVKTVISAISIPTALITAITTALTALVTLLQGPAALLPPGNPISDALNKIPALITSINNAVTGINNALTAINNLTVPTSTCSLLILLNSLNVALASLQTALDEVLKLVNKLITDVSSLLPALSGALNAIINPLIANINSLLSMLANYLSYVATLVTYFEKDNFFEIIPNAEDTCLTGREIVIEGVLHQNIMYTANDPTQKVYSVTYNIPFSAYIVVYASFVNLPYVENVLVVSNSTTCTYESVNGFYFSPDVEVLPNLNESFNVESFIENVYLNALDKDTMFKNVTVFLKANPQ